MNKQYKYLYIVSVLLLLSGAALAVIDHSVFDIIYGLGAFGYTAYYLLTPTDELTGTLRRAVRMGVFSGLLFLISAVARFDTFATFGQGLWLVFLALGLIYMIYGNVLLYIDERKKQ